MSRGKREKMIDFYWTPAALDKQHSNAGSKVARAMEGIAKQTQVPSQRHGSI